MILGGEENPYNAPAAISESGICSKTCCGVKTC